MVSSIKIIPCPGIYPEETSPNSTNICMAKLCTVALFIIQNAGKDQNVQT